MMLIVRKYEAKDRENYANLANSMFENLNDSVLTFEKDEYDWEKFVAEYENVIVGFLGYYHTTKEKLDSLKNRNDLYFGFDHDYHIFQIEKTCNWEYGGVSEKYRSRGIFTKLMEFAEREAFNKGFEQIAVWATVPEFFKSRGYDYIKELPIVQDTDGTLTSMIKNLRKHYG